MRPARLALLLAGPLLACLLGGPPAEARVVQPTDATERGGQVVKRDAAGPGCADAAGQRCPTAPLFGPLGWFAPLEMEAMTRLTGVARTGIVAERAGWRRPRLARGGTLRSLLTPRRAAAKLR